MALSTPKGWKAGIAVCLLLDKASTHRVDVFRTPNYTQILQPLDVVRSVTCRQRLIPRVLLDTPLERPLS